MRALLICVCLTLFLTGAPAAWAEQHFVPDASSDPGYISVGTFGDATDSAVSVTEKVGTRDVPVASLPLVAVPDAPQFAGALVKRASRWLCSRRTRVLTLHWTAADGTLHEQTIALRTPACSTRFRIELPVSAPVGKPVRVGVRDAWRAGDATVNLCVTPPALPVHRMDPPLPPRAPAPRCHRRSLAASHTLLRGSFTPRVKGTWTVSLTARGQTASVPIAVGVKPSKADKSRLPEVLLTGDSMMETLDAVLSDRLSGRASVDSDVRVGSGISFPELVDWDPLARMQIKQYAPKATVMFIGTNDAHPMTLPDGASVDCCGDQWLAEYQRRVVAMMQSYRARGGKLYWLTIPLPREDKRRPSAIAVDTAVVAAAKQVPGVTVLDMAAIFTPGGVYSDTLDGKVVRDTDGIHLTIPGARVAADAVQAALAKDGVL